MFDISGTMWMGAEWIRTRFGNGIGATMSHIVVVAFALLSALGFLSYGFISVGKFIEAFIPWQSAEPYLSGFLSRKMRQRFMASSW